MSIDRSKTSISLSERLENLIPSGKIASLNTGEMVGILAREPQGSYSGSFSPSAVNCKINLDLAAIAKEEAAYPPMPVFYDFGDDKQAVLLANFKKINDEVSGIIARFEKSS